MAILRSSARYSNAHPTRLACLFVGCVVTAMFLPWTAAVGSLTKPVARSSLQHQRTTQSAPTTTVPPAASAALSTEWQSKEAGAVAKPNPGLHSEAPFRETSLGTFVSRRILRILLPVKPSVSGDALLAGDFLRKALFSMFDLQGYSQRTLTHLLSHQPHDRGSSLQVPIHSDAAQQAWGQIRLLDGADPSITLELCVSADRDTPPECHAATAVLRTAQLRLIDAVRWANERISTLPKNGLFTERLHTLTARLAGHPCSNVSSGDPAAGCDLVAMSTVTVFGLPRDGTVTVTEVSERGRQGSVQLSVPSAAFRERQANAALMCHVDLSLVATNVRVGLSKTGRSTRSFLSLSIAVDNVETESEMPLAALQKRALGALGLHKSAAITHPFVDVVRLP